MSLEFAGDEADTHLDITAVAATSTRCHSGMEDTSYFYAVGGGLFPFHYNLHHHQAFDIAKTDQEKMLHVAVIAMLAPLDNPYKRSFVKDSNLLIVTNLIHC